MKPIAFLFFALSLGILGCTTETIEAPARIGTKSQPPSGFFNRLVDQFTERECNVIRFTCPYGLGPAGEPCDCTDPDGVVRQGSTVK